MSSKRATVNLPDNIRRILGDTTTRGLTGRIADIIDRYGEIAKQLGRELIAHLTEEEIKEVATVIRGRIWNPAADIRSGVAQALAAAGKGDLAGKVRDLTYPHQVALVERCESMSIEKKE